MFDLSQYVGEDGRPNFEIVEFWGRDAGDGLRKGRLIYLEQKSSEQPPSVAEAREAYEWRERRDGRLRDAQ
jgi:hypothetical protein